MKKIIFLFVLFAALIPLEVSANKILECDGSTFEIDFEAGKVTITKRGENPFMKTYMYEGRSTYVRDVACNGDTYTFFGFTGAGDPINFYDTLIFTMDKNGEVLFEQASDFGGNEETEGAVWIDQVLFEIIRVDTLGDRWNNIDPEFDYVAIKTYDINHEYLDTVLLDNKIFKYDSSDELLLLYYSYLGEVDVGIDTSMNLYHSSDVFDVKGIYEGEVEIAFINKGVLNGETVENGLYINYPGVFNLKYNSKEYQFIVHPIVEGVDHLMTYNESVTPMISAGNFTLNDELYLSGTEISNPGNYELSIAGINGYNQTIQFTITSQVEGVINGHDYKDPFVITFNGEGYLNNSLVVSPLQIEEEGDYVLRVNGVGGLSDQYRFTFTEENNAFSVQDVVQKIDILILVVAIIIGVVIIKKK